MDDAEPAIGRATRAVVNSAQGVEPFRETDRLSDAVLLAALKQKADGWEPRRGPFG